MKVALIDADSLVYIIGWNYRELGTEDEVRVSCDNFLKDILGITGTDQYIGAFSGASKDTFRSTVYKYNEYKGNRPEKPDFIVKWEKIIKDHYTTVHGFVTIPMLEADDIISAVSELYSQWPHVICSPDKDLRQVAGSHYDYKGKAVPESNLPPVFTVSIEEAFWNFWTQMLVGDESDNIAGVPGLGPVKAKKIIEELKDSGEKLVVRNAILSRYTKYFGNYYGSQIFNETYDTLKLMDSSHRYYSGFTADFKRIADNPCTLKKTSGFFDITN